MLITMPSRTGFVIPSVRFCAITDACDFAQNVGGGVANPAALTYLEKTRQKKRHLKKAPFFSLKTKTN